MDLPKPIPNGRSLPNQSPSIPAMPSEIPVPAAAPAPTPTPSIQRVVLVYSLVPDFCKMPNGSVVPFDLLAVYQDTVNDSANVFANKYGVCNFETMIAKCTGNEAAAGGVKSSTINGKIEMIPNGCTVKTNGFVTMRDGDLVFMNNQNTFGRIKVEDKTKVTSKKPTEVKIVPVVVEEEVK